MLQLPTSKIVQNLDVGQAKFLKKPTEADQALDLINKYIS